MVNARQATPGDARELMRLRKVMLESMDPAVPDGPWQQTGIELLQDRLGDDLAAFVVDQPEGRGLAACVVGAVDQRLPGPSDPTGLRGYVYSVATDPAYRRRGFSRACMTALLDWYTQRGISAVDLRASPDGRALYESLGFRLTEDPSMRIYLVPRP
ncbi:GNAT family N-acetyltransferase [Actinoplanes sp. TFC3]|uniref:GNAT family N-acetyltransferase n=1 Tax=Actinoplanes sp. TFC3 TaxID=1710355 RepID=UPI0008349F59|nr:GNAT family N-acetyltransferase [Actinoplanes sp. TFC3]